MSNYGADTEDSVKNIKRVVGDILGIVRKRKESLEALYPGITDESTNLGRQYRLVSLLGQVSIYNQILSRAAWKCDIVPYTDFAREHSLPEEEALSSIVDLENYGLLELSFTEDSKGVTVKGFKIRMPENEIVRNGFEMALSYLMKIHPEPIKK